jgi:tetratricopeptide (TPR) repeat protein/serine/threonine protein kinase
MMRDPSLNVEDIFLAALELGSAKEQFAYLEEVCTGNPELRRRVDRLLEAQAQNTSFLEAPAPEIQPWLDQRIAEVPGSVIGLYRLIEQIGEGGMGTVWMAQQTEPVKRLVAIKLIKAGMDSRQIIARFEAERQALALMDHPNIARVLDAGTTSVGRPYFVMDLVKGVPITTYCDAQLLTPRERLELFVPVCQAIQHAHQKGIIHRDLKPSNVVVAQYDGKPVPKVIDFGVAKAAGRTLTEKTLVTGFGSIVGTLEYMSPEQAEVNQLDIDTRSDIYSLGVVLYELLTGSPPFTRNELEKAGVLEMLRVIREQEPSKPSTKLSTAEGLPTLAANRGTEPASLKKLVRGELDWIVMKCLEKDRNRRYETANAVARDIEHYLHDEPVAAGPPSAWYRFRKFAHRNKGAVAATALVLCLLVLLGIGIGWAVRDRATRQARVAGQVELIFAEVDRLEREQEWSEALEAARRAEAAAIGGEADASTTHRVRGRLKDLEFLDRLEQIRMLRTTTVDGKIDMAGSDREYARAFRDYGVDVEALPVETLIDRLKTRPALAIPLAAALDDWFGTGRLVSEQDAARWQRLVAVARGIDSEPVRDRLRSTWEQPASQMHDKLRRLADSIDISAQHPATLVALALTLQRAKHPDSALRVLRDAQFIYPGDFWLNYELGFALAQQKDREGAIRFCTAAVSVRPNSGPAYNYLGNALYEQKKVEEAIAAYRKAIELDPSGHSAYENLGNALGDQAKLDEALAACRKAVELDPKCAMGYNNLGNAMRAKGKLDEALAAFREAIRLEPDSAHAHHSLGAALADQKKVDEAIAAYRKAIELDPKNARAYSGLGSELRQQKKLDEAIAADRKAIELDPKDAKAYTVLGNALLQQKDLDGAITAFRKGIELNPKDAYAYNGLGIVLYDQKKLDEAIAAYRKAIELDPSGHSAYENLGNALRDQSKLDEAIAACRKAIELDPNCASAYLNLGYALRDQKPLDKATDAFRKAIELDPKLANAHYALGNALRDQKKLEASTAAYRKALELDTKLVQAQINLGNVLARQKKLDKAIAAYRKAIELDPKDAYAYNGLGIVLYDQKKLDEAIAAYRKAIELDPKHVPAFVNLGHALQDQKKLDEAIAAYRKAIELDPKQAEAISSIVMLLTTCPDPKLRDPSLAVEFAKKWDELQPRSPRALMMLGWAQYGAGAWPESIEALERSSKLQAGGTGDSAQWIVLALAHAKLAAQADLPAKERAYHKTEARRRYEEANKQIDQWWRVRPGNYEGHGIWDFREEARKLMGANGEKK